MTPPDDRCGIDISLSSNYQNCIFPDKMVVQSGVAELTKEQAHNLGRYVRATREAKRLSASTLADYAGVAEAQVLRIERGEVAAPQATVLGRIAERLRIPVNDLFVLAGYPTSRRLPTIGPYLHAKYPSLSRHAVERLNEVLAQELRTCGHRRKRETGEDPS